jgi:1,4-alpha-glucan branching enzyme
VIGDDRAQSVFAYLRYGDWGDAPVLVVCNLTPVPRHDYRVGSSQAGAWVERFNSDAGEYGGSGMGNGGLVQAEEVGAHGQPASMVLTLPPLATLVLTPAAR